MHDYRSLKVRVQTVDILAAHVAQLEETVERMARMEDALRMDADRRLSIHEMLGVGCGVNRALSLLVEAIAKLGSAVDALQTAEAAVYMDRVTSCSTHPCPACAATPGGAA